MTAGALGPGATIGVLGGGQLGRMLAVVARQMGYRIIVLDPSPRCPTAQVADGFVVGALDDGDAARLLAHQVDVITLDTEHVPADLLADLEAIAPVRPGAAVLRTIQDRLVQKQFLDRLGLPQAAWAPAGDPAELAAALARIGRPAILKVRHAGYDGKGQVRIEPDADLDEQREAERGGDPAGEPVGRGRSPRGIDEQREAERGGDPAGEPVGRGRSPRGITAQLARLHGRPAVVEEVVPFAREVSVILARGLDGAHRIYPIAENVHRRHILHTTRAPAPMPEAQRRRAEEIAVSVADALGHVGVIAVELFELPDGRLLVNEIAPRTHNSGHYTYGACATSQFEQHVRAICGLALGDPRPLSGAVMVNLIGDLWAEGPPRWPHVLAHPGARLHLYGKDAPAPGRKMGHVVLLDDDTDRALADAEGLIAALAPPAAPAPRP